MDRRQALKDTAIRLFVEEGFQQTSTARVSKEAGVGTGTLFTYFTSKDHLINSIYTEAKLEQMAYVWQKLDENEPALKQLKVIWKQSVKWALDNEKSYRFIQLFEASSYGLAYGKAKQDAFELMLIDLHKKLENDKTEIPHNLLYRIIVSNQNALVDYLLKEKNGEYDKALTKQMLDVTLLGLV